MLILIAKLENRGSLMSVHVLLNLFNKLRKRVKCEVCQALYHFRNEFNKFNNTEARLLDCIYHMTSKLF